MIAVLGKRSIYHFSFSIFHFPFVLAIRTPQWVEKMENEKWKITNDK